MQTAGQKCFSEYLNGELQVRIQNSPKYSLRAFARDLSVDSSFLSKILSGKRAVTSRTIQVFGEKLKLSPEQIRFFTESCQTEKVKKRLSKMLRKMPAEGKEVTTLTFSVDESKLEAAKERCQMFREELVRLVQSVEATSDKKYQLTISLFPLFNKAGGASVELT